MENGGSYASGYWPTMWLQSEYNIENRLANRSVPFGFYSNSDGSLNSTTSVRAQANSFRAGSLRDTSLWKPGYMELSLAPDSASSYWLSTRSVEIGTAYGSFRNAAR